MKASFAQWRDDPKAVAALEEARRVLAGAEIELDWRPGFHWSFERICLAINTVGGLLILAGFAYLVFGR